MDPTTIAYLGEFNSGATAISLPVLNEAGILQVSPSNAYVGLTRAEGAERREPVQYYPAGNRSYGRVVPADHLQAAAMAALLQAEGVKRVYLVDDFEVYGKGLADMVSSRLGPRGIAVAGRRAPPPPQRRRHRPGDPALQGGRMVYAGITQNGAARLWNAVHRRNPNLKLFGPEGVAEEPFTRGISRGAARRTLMTNPTLKPSAYPPPPRRSTTRSARASARSPSVRDLRLRDDERRARRDPARRQQPEGGHRRLLRDQGPRLRPRSLLDRRER